MKFIKLIILFLVAGCWVSAFSAEKPKPVGNDIIMSVMQQETDSIIAPNVFTPNGDNINDLFEVTSSESNTVDLKIYTRAGILVFSIKAKVCQWDGRSQSGKEMAAGIYYYTAEIVGSSPKISKLGFVHLYR